MADRIKVTPETLRDRAETVRDYREEHMDVMTRLTNLVLGLSESWEGAAQDAFVDKYESKREFFRQFAEMLEKFATDMIDVADRMEQTDNSLSSRIDTIS